MPLASGGCSVISKTGVAASCRLSVLVIVISTGLSTGCEANQ
jgi:hypothetical protein